MLSRRPRLVSRLVPFLWRGTRKSNVLSAMRWIGPNSKCSEWRKELFHRRFAGRTRFSSHRKNNTTITAGITGAHHASAPSADRDVGPANDEHDCARPSERTDEAET